jgi:transcriptional regulator with XRE-family HTH domain
MTEEPTPSSLAAKLDKLFRIVRAAGQAEYTHQAVADAIRRDQGVAISHTYVWQLRTGRRDNPTLQHLTAIAKFFGVPVSYFLDEEQAAQIDRDLELLTAIKEVGVAEIALRTADLSPDSRDTVGDMIMKIWRLEHPDDNKRA